MRFLKEKLDKLLDKDCFITDNPYDILNLITNKPKPYRILYDSNINKYMICDAGDYIHSDMVEEAIKQGYYSTNKNVINIVRQEVAGEENFDGNIRDMLLSVYNYLDTGKYGDYDADIEPYLIYMTYTPNNADFDATSDDYDGEYKGINGTIYTRDSSLEDCELYTLGTNYNQR